jgi:ATP-dependent DNA helicase PIF1
MTELSIEQQYAFAKFLNGDNLFITGPGGTGKSKLIKHLVNHLIDNKIKYQVCALTGCAAVLLGGGAKTIHSWSGAKIATGSNDRIITRISRSKNAVSNWKGVKVLIVDEVSMMSCKLFELLEEAARYVRHNNRPFGGIQVVFTGDFFQLPPIPNMNEPKSAMFCFESEKWPSVFPLENNIELRTYFRQSDPQYINILDEIRVGKITKENADILHKYVNREFDKEAHGGIVPTQLYPIRAKVDYVNTTCFNKLEGDPIIYEYSYRKNEIMYLDDAKLIPGDIVRKCADMDEKEVEAEVNVLLSNINAAQRLSLKVGAIVMCTANLDLDLGICNGSQGIVERFAEYKLKTGAEIMVPVVKFTNGITMRIIPMERQSDEYPCIVAMQLPLCLAWALTIHKIQGATLSMAMMDIGKSIFEYGQTYVALSRIKSLDGLYLTEFHPQKIRANPNVITFYNSLPKKTKEAMQKYISEKKEVVPQNELKLEKIIKTGLSLPPISPTNKDSSANPFSVFSFSQPTAEPHDPNIKKIVFKRPY